MPATGTASSRDEIVPPRRGARNPWVLVGAGATAAVLLAGFVAFRAGDARASQRMMRARVLSQGATVALMVATSAGGLSSATSWTLARPGAGGTAGEG